MHVKSIEIHAGNFRPLQMIDRLLNLLSPWFQKLERVIRDGAPSPPPPLECKRGRMHISILSGKGVFLAVCLGKISREKSGGKGGVFKPTPEIWGAFQKLPEISTKRGYELYVYMFPEARAFKSLSRTWRKGDRALSTSHICGRAPWG